MTLLDEVSNFLRSAACELFESVDSLAGLFGYGEGQALTNFDFPAYAKSLVCGGAPAVPEPPFSGGQCPCEDYQVTLEFQGISAFGEEVGDPYTFTFRAYGPIGGAIVETSPAELIGGETEPLKLLYLPCRGDPLSQACRPTTVRREIFGFPGLRFRLLNQSVVLTNGNPDTCGDPVPARGALSSGWNQVSGDITLPGPGGGITVPIVGVFGQVFVDVDASVQIPITVNVGGIDIDFNFDLSRDVFTVTPPKGTDPRPGNQPTDIVTGPGGPLPPLPPGVPGPSLADDLADSVPGSRRVIVGVGVTVSSAPDSISVIYQDGTPDIYVPRLGSVHFLYRVGQSGGLWSHDLDVKNRRQVIWTPGPVGAIRVAGTPAPGVEWTLTPLYSKKGDPIIFE